MTRMKKGIAVMGVGGVLVLVLMVIIGNVTVSHDNPPVTYDKIQWDSPETEAMMKAACYDCHSNETKWPWYSYVAPMSFLVGKHVEEGRHEMNFSTGRGELEKHEMIEQIEKGEMPPASYLIMHPEAYLSDQQKEALIEGIKASTLR